MAPYNKASVIYKLYINCILSYIISFTGAYKCYLKNRLWKYNEWFLHKLKNKKN